MKTKLFLCVIIYLSLGFSLTSFSQVAEKYLISFKKVGPYSRGMKISDAKKIPNIKKATEHWADIDGGDIPIDYYYFLENDGSRVEFWGLDKVDYIIIYSPKYKTSKGVGVGSTIEEVASKYPKYYIMDCEKGFYFYHDDLSSIELIFNKASKTNIRASNVLSSFKKNTKIEAVVVYFM